MKTKIFGKTIIVISIFIIIIFLILFINGKINILAFLLGIISQIFVIIQQLIINKK
jgi:hypothetical protein